MKDFEKPEFIEDSKYKNNWYMDLRDQFNDRSYHIYI